MKLFEDLNLTVRRVKIAGTVNLTGDQVDALKMGRAVELLVTAVVQTRTYKRDKDGVREAVTLVPIASEVQSVGTDVVDNAEIGDGDE